MVILRPENSTHSITVIPRINAENITIVIKNESKNTTETIEGISTTYANGYLTFEIEKTVLESESFEYAIYGDLPLTADTTLFSADSTILSADMTKISDGGLIFRGKAFATNQTDLQNYKIN